MSAASTVADAASVDWNIVAGAAATFIITALLTWQGLRKGKRKVEESRGELTTIAAASVMDNATMARLSDALKENTEALRQNTAIHTRAIDVAILIHRD